MRRFPQQHDPGEQGPSEAQRGGLSAAGATPGAEQTSGHRGAGCRLCASIEGRAGLPAAAGAATAAPSLSPRRLRSAARHRPRLPALATGEGPQSDSVLPLRKVCFEHAGIKWARASLGNSGRFIMSFSRITKKETESPPGRELASRTLTFSSILLGLREQTPLDCKETQPVRPKGNQS